MRLASNIEQRLGYNFKTPSLLNEALSHPSMRSEKKLQLDYERLEFLGDAILNFLITEYLFTKFTDSDEGHLAKMRAALVCKEAICDVAEDIDLDEYLIMTRGEEISGGRSNQNNVENCMEAIIGAIYLDGGIDTTREVVLNLWAGIIADGRQFVSDPKSALQEWSQGHGMSIPRYQVVERVGQDHAPMFKVGVTIDDLVPEYGTGKSIKAAEKMAAKKMLERERE